MKEETNNKTTNSKNSFEKKLTQGRNKITPGQDEHNMEFVSEVKGVAYVNDSKSSCVSHLITSFESIEAPVILILGGYDSGNDYSIVSTFNKKKLKAIIYLGNNEESILKNYKNDSSMFVTAMSVEEAVKTAYWFGKKGDVVLFCPACPSNAFDSYKTRGDEFKSAVKILRG